MDSYIEGKHVAQFISKLLRLEKFNAAFELMHEGEVIRPVIHYNGIPVIPNLPFEVTVDNEFLFNHLCGCTKCWKPDGADFSMLAAVPSDKIKVTKHEEKLKW